jgi:hypothetical protein
MIEFAIAAAPLLLLLVALLLGCYPGCEVAMRLLARIASLTRRDTVERNSRRPQPPTPRAVHGGLLIAFSLAQRPPPLAA